MLLIGHLQHSLVGFKVLPHLHKASRGGDGRTCTTTTCNKLRCCSLFAPGHEHNNLQLQLHRNS